MIYFLESVSSIPENPTLNCGGISPYHMTGVKTATSFDTSIVRTTVNKKVEIIAAQILGNPN